MGNSNVSKIKKQPPKLTYTSKEILSLLEIDKSLTRKEICDKLNICWSTAYDSLYRLELNKLVKRLEIYPDERKKGRPKVLWVLL